MTTNPYVSPEMRALWDYEQSKVPALHTYKGYKITVRKGQVLNAVSVFDPHFPRAQPLYKTTSLDEAMRWVDAYIKGEAWTMGS